MAASLFLKRLMRHLLITIESHLLMTLYSFVDIEFAMRGGTSSPKGWTPFHNGATTFETQGISCK